MPKNLGERHLQLSSERFLIIESIEVPVEAITPEPITMD